MKNILYGSIRALAVRSLKIRLLDLISKNRKRSLSAEYWFSEVETEPFSLAWVCMVLNLSIKKIRNGAIQFKKEYFGRGKSFGNDKTLLGVFLEKELLKGEKEYNEIADMFGIDIKSVRAKAKKLKREFDNETA